MEITKENVHVYFWQWIEKALENKKDCEEMRIGNVEFWKEGRSFYFDIPCSQWDNKAIGADLVAYVGEALILLSL